MNIYCPSVNRIAELNLVGLQAPTYTDKDDLARKVELKLNNTDWQSLQQLSE